MANQFEIIRGMVVQSWSEGIVGNLHDGYNSLGSDVFDILQKTVGSSRGFVDEQANALEEALGVDPGMSLEDKSRLVSDAAVTIDNYFLKQGGTLLNLLNGAVPDVADFQLSGMNGDTLQATDSISLLLRSNPEIANIIIAATDNAPSAGEPSHNSDGAKEAKLEGPIGDRFFNTQGPDVASVQVAHGEKLNLTFKSVAGGHDSEEARRRDIALQMIMNSSLSAQIERIEWQIQEIEKQIATNKEEIAKIDAILEQDARNQERLLEIENEQLLLRDTIAADSETLTELNDTASGVRTDLDAVETSLADKEKLLEEVTANQDAAWEDVDTATTARDETFNNILSPQGMGGAGYAYSISTNAAGEETLSIVFAANGYDEFGDLQSYTFDELNKMDGVTVTAAQWQKMMTAQEPVDAAYDHLNVVLNKENKFSIMIEIEALETDVKELGSTLSGLEAEMKTLEDSIATNKESLKTLAAEHEKVSGELLTEEQRMELEQRRTDLVAENVKLAEELSLLYEEVSTLREQQVAQSEAITVLMMESDNIGDVSTVIDDMKTLLGKIEADREASYTEYDTATTRRDETFTDILSPHNIGGDGYTYTISGDTVYVSLPADEGFIGPMPAESSYTFEQLRDIGVSQAELDGMIAVLGPVDAARSHINETYTAEHRVKENIRELETRQTELEQEQEAFQIGSYGTYSSTATSFADKGGGIQSSVNCKDAFCKAVNADEPPPAPEQGIDPELQKFMSYGPV